MSRLQSLFRKEALEARAIGDAGEPRLYSLTWAYYAAGALAPCLGLLIYLAIAHEVHMRDECSTASVSSFLPGHGGRAGTACKTRPIRPVQDIFSPAPTRTR